MTQKIEIPCGTVSAGPDAYKSILDGETGYTVIMTVNDMEALNAAKENPSLRGKEGEALVAAVQAIMPDNISSVERYKAGKLQDGPNGEPASVIRPAPWAISKNSRLEQRCQNGVLNDGANGEPAALEICDDGWIISKRRYQNGLLQDAADGEPAEQSIQLRDGSFEHVKRYTKGALNDGPNGEPAMQMKDIGSGKVEIKHYKNGLLNDTPDGEAAEQLLFKDGSPEYLIHHKDNKKQDPSDGSPAFVAFNEQGRVRLAIRYNKGHQKRALGLIRKRRLTKKIQKSRLGGEG